MSLTPEQVARVTPPIGSDWDIAKNRDHVAADTAGKLTEHDLTATTTGRAGLWIGYSLIAGPPVDHGEVADEAAMIALHDWAADPLTTSTYHYVAPGDSCTRADDPGYRWHCLAGHGQWAAHWERRPLAAAVGTAAGSATWGGVTGDLSDQADLVAALDELAPLSSPALTGTPTAPTQTAGNNSTRIATTAFVAAAVSAAGGGAGIKDGLLHWVVGRSADNAAIDLHSGDTWTWSGTAATAAGKLTTALSFGGSSWISRTLSGSRIFTDGFSRAAWINPSSLSGAMFLSSIGAFASSQTSYQYCGNYSGAYRVVATISTDGANDSAVFNSYSDPVTAGSWVFVVQIYDPLGRSYSYNFVGAVSGVQNTPVKVYHAVNPTLYVGAGNTTNTSRWRGLIDSWAIWNRQLTAREVVRLWNNGDGLAYDSL